jgi:superfamily I DNA/RNA helicase
VLNPRFNARFVQSKDIQFDEAGVRVMTIHSAKGLEFGVVVAARIDARLLEAKGPPPEEELTSSGPVYDQRLLFVACSRAIRRLMVSTRPGVMSDPPSLNLEDYWDVWTP